jgi:hypothetical protein
MTFLLFFLSFYYVAFIAIRKAVIYECCPAVYPFVLFTIQIRRRTLYYVVNVVGKSIEIILQSEIIIEKKKIFFFFS